MISQKSLTSRSWAELVVLSAIWGGSFMAIRIALDEMGVASVVAHRVFWAAVILWGAVAWMRIPVPAAPRVWADFAVMGLLNNVIPFTLMAWGQRTIETGLTSILNASTAIFGVIVAAVFFTDERLTARRAAGVGLGFAGVITVIGPGALTALDLRSLAQIAVLGGTLSYALAGAWGRARLSHLPPVLCAAGMLSASAAIMVPAALLIDGMPGPISGGGIAAIAYYALAATALAYLLYYRVLAAAGSGNLMLCTLLIAPIAILLGAVFLGEQLAPGAYAGFALLAAGLAIIARRPLPKTPEPG
ncbi:DMT family transporter [Profundibacterium mesophilum]|uniref:ABC transporter membrane spanning protein n=1 Tax=Profundibacterium mesophilum KAUST100406-0324 TaxID=1037889 RepID=A0A921NSZ8_9RHOB|nr:DMT family transporter [Profundibacterium mesophilum]KAF0677465.1 ABC transporter membrane spanning protein [Profundibacterium mesophilum KAUST100406-0324]